MQAKPRIDQAACLFHNERIGVILVAWLIFNGVTAYAIRCETGRLPGWTSCTRRHTACLPTSPSTATHNINHHTAIYRHYTVNHNNVTFYFW